MPTQYGFDECRPTRCSAGRAWQHAWEPELLHELSSSAEQQKQRAGTERDQANSTPSARGMLVSIIGGIAVC